MGRKIVGMISSYTGVSKTDWLWQQTPHPFGVWGNIQMLATAKNPDFLLLYNFHNFPELNSKKHQNRSFLSRFRKPFGEKDIDMPALLRGVPRERIVSLVREPPFEKMRRKRLAEYQCAQAYCGYVSGPDNFAPVPNYMPAIWYHANSFRELNEMASPEKEKPCCWMTSGIDRTAEHRRRLSFLKRLRESELDFDLYGRRLPDWAGGYGQFDNKWNVMAPYYYNLAIENYAENEWYVSEKLWDALLAWCLPIYYGSSAADKLLPPGSFLRLPSLDEKGVAYIQEVTATLDVWHERRAAIAEARQVILHELNLLNFLSNLVEKLG
ncbi:MULTISPECIES: glycosyltransferase family 10 domain-containing protein [unclassified Coleofasciculus]|uniref:glycosyltransferase family 10 domain-containing protein n=1 Tax=unclassified Coleofasciculus TaxID=2692782 RepID=UPI001881D62D|nr:MULTISPECIES: glycosyltransferase family 10 [unclassified Coleofasciculus]MBE9124808.1 glycosyltransferase [Coleofasciculus sp. LEGE 07081]MBE9147713.1 glycosyltransferase [Coleofasciculus sp. LEGE 07092]